MEQLHAGAKPKRSRPAQSLGWRKLLESMWSLARVELGMTREEFLACRPREFDAFCQKLEARERKQRFNAALVCSILAEINRNPKVRTKPFAPAEFMCEPEPIQSDEQQVKMLRLLFGHDMKPDKAKARLKVKHG